MNALATSVDVMLPLPEMTRMIRSWAENLIYNIQEIFLAEHCFSVIQV